MTNLRDVLWQFRIKLIARISRFKAALLRFKKGVVQFDARQSIAAFFLGIKPFFKHTPQTLTLWTTKVKGGRLRLILLFSILAVCFGLASTPFYFTANDGFISFRYVANAVAGFGYTWNPPPFLPVNGYTSFLWLVCLRVMWFFNLLPPFSADILTFFFSMGAVVFGFLFLRRMPMPSSLQSKSLYLFLLYCLVLILNHTFLAFFWSGTETALFNFLVLWWTYEATSKKKRPVRLAVAGALLAMTRWDGLIFLPFTVLLLLLFFRSAKLKTVVAAAVLGMLYFFFRWQTDVYGSVIPAGFKAFYLAPFPAFGKDYLGSFIIEYALYFWLVFVFAWAGFKILMHRVRELAFPLLMIFFFTAYALTYIFVMGADVLEYRPFSFFIPLITIGAFRIMTNNITRTLRFITITTCLYLLLSLAIPLTHYNLTKNLSTRKETAFLYKPIPPEKKHFFTFFADYWNKAQRRLIYQGAALRHKEHQVLFAELQKSLPSRTEGERIKPEYRRLFAWDFAGQAGWVFPNVFIIDTSGQNDLFVAAQDNRYPDRRLLGHEKVVPPGYISCFNGGSNLVITPFDGTPDVAFPPSSSTLTDGIIKGCEGFWQHQAKLAEQKKNPVLRRK